MKLFVKANYQSPGLFFPAGKSIEVEDELADFLLCDAPDCFDMKEIEEPPADKMISKAPRKKSIAKKAAKKRGK